MAIEKNHEYRALSCDECGETLEEFHNSDFTEMIATAKRKGWLIKKSREGWSHYCEAHHGAAI